MNEKRLKEKEGFDFKVVPAGWQLCFCEDCPRHGECLRFQAGLYVPSKLHWGPAVYPAAWKSGECEFFKEACIETLAWGFKPLFRDVKQKDYTPLRNEIKSYLGGHGTYYRYNRGERLLNPEQQQHILELFRRRGYTEGLAFEHYLDDYDFG